MTSKLGAQSHAIACALFALSIVSFLSHIISFSVDYWYKSDPELSRPFVRLGLHRICFNNFYESQGDEGNQPPYNGCHEYISNILRDIERQILTDWFSNVRTMMIINVPLLACTMFINILFFVIIVLQRFRKTFSKQSRFIQILFFLVAVAFLAAALISLIALMIFYANCKNREWLPNRHQYKAGHLLGYAFWLQCATCALLFISFILAIIGGVFKSIALSEKRSVLYSEDMALSGRSV